MEQTEEPTVLTTLILNELALIKAQVYGTETEKQMLPVL